MIDVRFPNFFEKADINETSNLEDKIKIIKKHNGELVLIHDDHHSRNDYLLCIIEFDPNDKLCYFIEMVNYLNEGLSNKIRLHYHDLNEILCAGKSTAFHKKF